MTITLTPELEAALAEEAKRLGKTPEELAIEKLRISIAAQVHGERQLHKNLTHLLEEADKLDISQQEAPNHHGTIGELIADKFRKQGFHL